MPDWKEAIRERLGPARLDAVSEHEVVEELAQHLEDRYQELRANGTPHEECCLRALAELDDRDLLTKGVQLARRSPIPIPAVGVPASRSSYLHGLIHDFKVALRSIRIRPAFSLMVIGMLTLGIGGNAAIFSIFNGLFLRPLPFPASNRLIDLDETAPKWNLRNVGVSNIDSFEWSKSNSTFDSMAFFRLPSYNMVDREMAQRVIGAQVTHTMLDVLGLKPAIGRNFQPVEDESPGAKVVLLSYDLWQRIFHGDGGVIGRVLKLDEQAYIVIGVLPREAVFPDRAELWTPLAPDPNIPAGYYVNGVGRLKPGVSIEQARADLLRVHKGMIAQGNKVNDITAPILTPLRERYLGDYHTVGRILLGAVGMVLLIVCVNIAALTLVRNSFRTREIAIRTAIGASRGRIVAHVLTENLVMAGVGGALGVVLAAAFLRAIVSRMPREIPQWISFSLDGRFALFCIAITGAAALLFGLAPVFQASRIDARGALQDARTTSSRGHRKVLGALVACEIGLALMLSISAGLLVQAFRKILQVDPGFRPENVITFRLSLPDATYAKPEQKIAYFDNLLARVQAVPGVKAAGATSAPPLGGQWGGVFEAEGGRSAGSQGENPVVLRIAATPGYFDAIGMTLLDGRAFTRQDSELAAPRMVLVNETFAKHFWGNGRPVGKRIRHPGEQHWYQVIGVLRDEKHYGIDQEMKPSVFEPYAPTISRVDTNDARALRFMSIIVRASTDPKMVIGPAREIVRQLDPNVPMYAIQTMTEQLDRSLWSRRAYSWLFGVFAAVAILLAGAGVYGMVSYSVTQRTHEIGIRVALGAQPGQVLRQVLLGGMTLVSAGVAAGLLGALSATRLLRTLLFGVSSRDPIIYGATVLGIIGVGLLANLLPARRAAAMDPMRALHLNR